jgi:hypothetical protein
MEHYGVCRRSKFIGGNKGKHGKGIDQGPGPEKPRGSFEVFFRRKKKADSQHKKGCHKAPHSGYNYGMPVNQFD